MSIQSQIQALASELASQLPALAQDSPLNAAQVIANRITEAVQPEIDAKRFKADRLEREANKLLAMVAELEQDKARLDWMNTTRLRYVRGTNFPAWVVEGNTEHQQTANDETLRQAIDAAMKEQP